MVTLTIWKVTMALKEKLRERGSRVNKAKMRADLTIHSSTSECLGGLS